MRSIQEINQEDHELFEKFIHKKITFEVWSKKTQTLYEEWLNALGKRTISGPPAYQNPQHPPDEFSNMS